MPPNLAVNTLPAGVRWIASKHRRFPNGVSTVLLWRSRMIQGGRRCLAAKVESIDRSMYWRSLFSQLMFPAIWKYWT